MNVSALEEKELAEFLSHFTLPLKEKIPPATQKKKIIVISGPTAVGKSALALSIAHEIGGEIVSADSMQVYQGMDIGTAKVTPEERKKVPHHLIDIREIDETFNVVDFHTEACAAIQDIHRRGKVPIVVGGTGFYIHALIYGPPHGPPAVPEIRDKLEKEMKDLGPAHLYTRLQNLDPDYAASITQGDRHKIIRALEIINVTSRKVSQFPKAVTTNIPSYDFRCWFLHMPKEVIYPRIEQRCDQMIASGFIDEVRKLDEAGLRKNLSASQAIGYRQCLDFLSTAQTEADHQTFLKEFKQASRRYAKRQFTWFRKEPLFRWLNLQTIPQDAAAEIILQDFEKG